MYIYIPIHPAKMTVSEEFDIPHDLPYFHIYVYIYIYVHMYMNNYTSTSCQNSR